MSTCRRWCPLQLKSKAGRSFFVSAIWGLISSGVLVHGVLLQLPTLRHSRFPEFRSLLANGQLKAHHERTVELQIPGWGYSKIVQSPQKNTLHVDQTTGRATDAIVDHLLTRAKLPKTILQSLQEFGLAADRYYKEGLVKRRFQTLYDVFRNQDGVATTGLSVEKAARFVFLDAQQRTSWKAVKGKVGTSGAQSSPTPGELVATLMYLSRNDPGFHKFRRPGVGKDRTAQDIMFGFESANFRDDALRVGSFTKTDPKKPQFEAFLKRMNDFIGQRRGTREVIFKKDDGLPRVEHVFPLTDQRLMLTVLRGLRQPGSKSSLQALRIMKCLPQFYLGKGSDGMVIQLARDAGLFPPWDEQSIGLEAATQIALVNLDRPATTDETEARAVWVALLERWSQVWARRLLGEKIEPEEEAHLLSQPLGRKDRRDQELPGHELHIQMPSLRVVKKESDVLKYLAADSILPSTPATSGERLSPVLPLKEIKDPHEAIRQRYKPTVYVIDEPGAHELDDGISIAPREEGDDPNLSPWIEVHVADPATWLPPDHPISLIGQQRWTSIYMPTGHLPMIPDCATVELLDLRDRDAEINGLSGRYALTFSGRLDLRTGDLADYRVRCTLLENVKITSYDAVNVVLDSLMKQSVAERRGHSDPLSSIWSVSQHPRQTYKSSFRDITEEEDRQNLGLIYQLAEKHLAFRTSRGAYQPDQIEYAVKTAPQNLPSAPYPFPPHKPVYPIPDGPEPPSVRISHKRTAHLSAAQIVVSECMIMAGRIAAKYCQDHDIPIIYRGQPSIIDVAREKNRTIEPDPVLGGGEYRIDPNVGYPPIEQLEELVDSVMKFRDPKTGLLSFFGLNKLLPFMPPSRASLDPIPHFSMGIDGPDPSNPSRFIGYTRATSPLRRFPDMLLHWNVKAHLLGQPFPFTRDDMAKLMARGQTIEKIAENAMTKAKRYWELEWIRRREVLARFGRDPMKLPTDNVVEKTTMPHVDPKETTVPYAIGGALEELVPALQGRGMSRKLMAGQPALPPAPKDIEERPVYQAYVTSIARFRNQAQVVIIDLAGVVAYLNFKKDGLHDGDLDNFTDEEKQRLKYKVGDLVRVVVDMVDPYHSLLIVKDVDEVLKVQREVEASRAREEAKEDKTRAKRAARFGSRSPSKL